MTSTELTAFLKFLKRKKVTANQVAQALAVGVSYISKMKAEGPTKPFAKNLIDAFPEEWKWYSAEVEKPEVFPVERGNLSTKKTPGVNYQQKYIELLERNDVEKSGIIEIVGVNLKETLKAQKIGEAFLKTILQILVAKMAEIQKKSPEAALIAANKVVADHHKKIQSTGSSIDM